MPGSVKQYRQELHRLRSHPKMDSGIPEGFHDQRDSFFTVYLSLIPFLGLEYLTELSYEVLPGGLVFPTGFLLFWAFYYAFYKPGILEEHLSAPVKWDLKWIPTLILGVLIWFVKFTIVEVSNLLLLKWWTPSATKPTPSGATHSRTRPQAGPQRAAQTPPKNSNPPNPKPSLPTDLLEALMLLGLKPGCSWHDIHRQYRHLAKQFHPDLNPDITDGHRFMRVDAAYRRLDRARAQYFPE